MAHELAPYRVSSAHCAANVAHTCVRALFARHAPPVNLLSSLADQPVKKQKLTPPIVANLHNKLLIGLQPDTQTNPANILTLPPRKNVVQSQTHWQNQSEPATPKPRNQIRHEHEHGAEMPCQIHGWPLAMPRLGHTNHHKTIHRT